MTPVQSESLPPLLDGRDIRVQAKTGSGKTVAFALSLIQGLDQKLFRPQSLVLCPTRELAQQITGEVRKLSRLIPNIKVLALYGGKSEYEQSRSLHHGVHILVGTPGRVKKMLKTRDIDATNIKKVVLDEADRMLDMGFYDDILEIIGHVPKNRQCMLFSATFPATIKELSKKILKDPVRIKVDSEHDDNTITEYAISAEDQKSKKFLIPKVLDHFNPKSTLIFCNMKDDCHKLKKYLTSVNIKTLELHGDLDQKDRTLNINKFINNTCSIIIATDVAARGLDIDKLGLVINYDISLDLDVHTHRIGRTARAGEKGIAVHIYNPKEKYLIQEIDKKESHLLNYISVDSLKTESTYQDPSMMSTLLITLGRKDKIRPGDILGSFTNHIAGEEVGKINIFETFSYIAIKKNKIKDLLNKLKNEKVKGKSFRAQVI